MGKVGLKILLFFLVMIGGLNLYAGEEEYLDYDSVDIYSDKTTKYFVLSRERMYTENVYNQVNHKEDYIFLHRFKYKSNSREFYQNLSINGSPHKLLYFFDVKNKLGYNLGYSDFELYFDDLDKGIFFDTKSPYVDFKVNLARYGSFDFEGLYSRNISKSWNIGFSFINYTSQREFFENSYLDTSDRAIIINGLRVFSAVSLFDNKYRILASVSIMKRRMRELGGIEVYPLDYDKNFFVNTNKEKLYLDSETRIQNRLSVYNRLVPFYKDGYKSGPEAINFKVSANLWQDYKFSDSLQLYNNSIISSTTNFFEYRNRQEDGSYSRTKEERRDGRYKTHNLKSDSIDDEESKILKHNLAFMGVKFDQKLNLYSYYQDLTKLSSEFGSIVKINNFLIIPYYRFENNWISRSAGSKNANALLSEEYLSDVLLDNFVGLEAEYDIKQFGVRSVGFFVELLLLSEFSISGSLNTDYGVLHIELSQKSPYGVQQKFNWNDRSWKNNFNDIEVFNLSYLGDFKTKYIDISPVASYCVVNNPVFYKEKSAGDDVREVIKNRMLDSSQENLDEYIDSIVALNPAHICEPIQEKEKKLSLGYLGAQTLFKVKSFRLLLNVIYGKEFNDLSIARFPAVSANIMLYYLGKSKSERANFSTGLDCVFKTSYKGDSYDSVLQQFYVQDKFTIYEYPILDLFFNFRIDSFNMFVKWSHFNEFLFGSTNYFSSAYYPGSKMSLDLGIRWSFFD